MQWLALSSPPTSSATQDRKSVNLTPPTQPARRYMQQDDNYIYPADGSDTGARYPAPRPITRPYGTQVYQQLPQPQSTYDPAYSQQGYYYQPQPRQYYQPRNYYQN